MSSENPRMKKILGAVKNYGIYLALLLLVVFFQRPYRRQVSEAQ
jgi:hypothetical protein